MAIKVRVVYDGKVLQLKEPLDVAPGTEMQIIIEAPEDSHKNDYLFFRTARSLVIHEGPSDWSEKYEEYLYPDPPRSHRDDEE
jgi:predicted DNA-binding antitoxin AbrB/MazE fold protein